MAGRPSHGWPTPEAAEGIAAAFAARNTGGDYWLPAEAISFIRGLPLGRRRMTHAEAAAAPAGLCANMGRYGLTLGAWHGPGWATAVYGRPFLYSEGEARPQQSLFFQALRAEFDRRRARVRLHTLPFVLRGHLLARFVGRAGRDPGDLFGGDGETLATVVYGTAVAMLLSGRGLPGGPGAPAPQMALSFRGGAVVGPPGLVRGPCPGLLTGSSVVFAGEMTGAEVPNPASARGPGAAALGGAMPVFSGATFLSWSRMARAQREVAARCAAFRDGRAAELSAAVAEAYLGPGGAPASEAVASRPGLFDALWGLVERGGAELEESKRVFEDSRRTFEESRATFERAKLNFREIGRAFEESRRAFEESRRAIEARPGPPANIMPGPAGETERSAATR